MSNRHGTSRLAGAAALQHTVVVGAGLAGLSAARELVQHGRRVTLMEARERLGGRVLSMWDSRVSRPIELGPEWLEKQGPVAALLRRANVPVVAAHGKRVRRNGSGWEELHTNGNGHGRLMKRLAELDGPDRSLAAALNEYSADPALSAACADMTQYVAGFHAADPAKVSVQWLLQAEKEQPASASDQRCSAGLERALDVIFGDVRDACELRLANTVCAIRWKRGNVQIQTQEHPGEVFHCTSVVITVPVAVLRAPSAHRTSIQFEPPIRRKLVAASLIETGPVYKIVLRFREPFWHETRELRSMLFLHDYDQPFPTWWLTAAKQDPLLTGWSGGVQARGLLGAREDALVDRATTSLAHALRVPQKVVEDELEQTYFHDWSRDPCSLGAYTYVAPGGLKAHQVVAEPLDDTLFFAGEATCGGGHNATVEGAMESGVRAAREALGA